MLRIAAILLSLLVATPVEPASFGIFQVNGPGAAILKRTGFNMSFTSTTDYAFIDMLQSGDDFPGPHSGWTLSAPVWNSGILDAAGWPCTKGSGLTPSCPYAGATNPAQSGRDFGGGIHIPSASNYSGNYCLQGVGSGTLSLVTPAGGFFVAAQGTVTCAGFNGSANNCTSANASGTQSALTVSDDTWSGWCVALTASNIPYSATYSTNTALYIANDDPNNNGHYVKNVHFYEQGDGSDFAAGKMFRSAWKQQIVTLDPAFVRFLNWNGLTGAMRWTDRPTPINTPYSNTGVVKFAGQLPYAPATVSSNVLFSVAAVTGTPASMLHGEQLILTSPQNTPGGIGPNNITSISISGTTVTVGVASNTVFTTGDTVVFFNLPAGDSNLNFYYQASITVDSSTQIHFTFANAASLSTCSSSCGTVAEGYTVQVGSGSDRVAYPWFDTNGLQPFGVGEITTTGQGWRLCFSKTLQGSSNGSGTRNYGAWYVCGYDVAPLEYQVELVNELNAMGPVHPINMWVSTPGAGLICSTYYSDPDCSSGVDWPINMVNTILNGANGFAGLCAQCFLIVEDANETWNSSSAVANFLGTLSAQPATVGKVGCGAALGDINAYSTLHSELVMNDIQATYPLGGSRVKYSLGGWGLFATPTTATQAYARMTGTGIGLTSCQPQPPAGSNAPITLYDYMHIADYVGLGGTSCVPANQAMIQANWASDVNTFGFSSSQAQADLAGWTGPMTTCTNSDGTTIANFETLYSGLATTIAGYGANKAMISYEGWWNDNINVGGFITALSCSGGTVTATESGGAFSSPMVIQNVSVAGYNGVFNVTGSASSFTYTAPGGTCPVGTPSASAYQGYYGLTDNLLNGFLRAARDSAGWSTDYQGFLNWVASQANVGIPGFYTQVPNSNTWGVVWPDTYGASSTEGSGADPSWTMMGNFNRAQAN